jgi:hypothetical protein
MTRYKNKKIFHENADDREHLSSEEFISDNDETIDSFVIMKDQHHLEKFYFEREFTVNIFIDLTESDYLTSELMISLLEHFDV